MHIGSNVFNKEFFEYALDMIEKDTHEKVIYLNGDILEVGSKSVGNSAFKQKIIEYYIITIFLNFFSYYQLNS